MKPFAIAGACVAVVLAAASAAAGPIDMNAVAAEAAKPIGVGAGPNTFTSERDDAGRTILRVTLPSGFRYLVANDQCVTPGSPPTNCERLAFILIFNASAGDFSPQTLNEWNATRPPQAFKTPDGSTMLAFYVYARDGVSAKNIAHNFEFWNNAIIAFNNFLAAAPKGTVVSVSGAASPALAHPVHDWSDHGWLRADAGNERVALPD